jgi:uncharacterized RDD family membrane protein YckC
MQTAPRPTSPQQRAPSTAPDAAHAEKPDLTKRALAALLDGVVGVVLSVVPWIGGLLGAAYWLVRDGLDLEFMDGRSIGKKIMKLRPVRLDGLPASIETSVKRNWMFAVGGIASFFSNLSVVGLLLVIPLSLVALGLVLFEVFKVITDDSGRRLGDTMAGTKVVETS